ncbi:hypothetical protein CHS0354_037424 [Potamilus streckersoni]|uniref:U5 small nuclear ribonucleoprotein 200 kDa helicase n=1 Tax=Potamilus streckersoni TaxID=2493646 RepID=A0AAE0VI34_9BIVA|nr:hypothetical protein CHS0354_037424 [Potamilus streckersoni]
MRELPRITGAIRALSQYPGEETDDKRQGTQELLQKRHLVTKRRATEEGSVWSQLVERIRKEASAQEEEVTATLKLLTQCARQIVGKDTENDVVESAAVYLFDIFKPIDKVGHRETTKIRAIFGPFPASAATAACDIVNRIKSWLDEDIELPGNHKREEGDGEENITEFGKGIKFTFPTSTEVEEEESSSESEDEDRKEFDIMYNDIMEEKPSRKKKRESSDKSEASFQMLDAAWLQQEVSKYFGDQGSTSLGLSVEDLTSTIFDFLSSCKSDTELQNDLFELLGFDRFELIQSLLHNRQKLIAITLVPEDKVSQSNRNKGDSSRPAYGCQVTVQSEKEKQLAKQFRKEEKKMKTGKQDDSGQPMTFNPQELRAQRELALHSASAVPLFSGRSAYTPAERFPNVYDTMQEARQSSAFIGDVKMYLPENFQRSSNKIYEEVHIPSGDPAPLQVGEKLVAVAELDEIAQMAFKGTKFLNRIQSVVFEAAYRTNENLLICAPTGAGKTNIAMLTILHELKQHIAQGVIKKDEFKVIYVAPMKALAAEMVRNFGGRLEPLGIAVRELTGDMQLTKAEILNTQMLVTTPEKWDVVTRKSTGDVALAQLVKLLIIDEVHLLHDDRGSVIESLVARTLRQVESSQSMIRIVGLSATLPNYLDVANFLHVNPYMGLFFFDGRFRPVPLSQTFIGIKTLNRVQQLQDFNTVCYEKVLEQVRKGYQVMVFVHARNETVRTAMTLRDMAKNQGDVQFFLPDQGQKYGEAERNTMKSRNRQLKELFPDGFSIHHAGMLRQDRNLVEKYFAAGLIKVLVCTATLAWGVNLPAHAVIIKGTQIYDAKKGSFVDLGILDVMQIFGRAGRPQFDKFGHGTILSTHDKLSHYLSLMTRQNPIESQFVNSLTDNLNAEIALGTVTNVDEAVKWLSYTYLYVRMKCNPLVYGVPYKMVENDPTLEEYRRELIVMAGRKLDQAKMVRFNEKTNYFASTDMGRIASHFYIKYDTVEVINEHLKYIMTEGDVFGMVAKSQEFEQIKVRDDEMEELDIVLQEHCEMNVPGGVENTYGKVNILLQAYISRQSLDSFSLVSDQAYIAQVFNRFK